MPTRAERDRAVRMYTETRLPVGEIAKRMGVSRATIHRWLQSADVEHRGPMGPRGTYVADEPRITLSESEAILEGVSELASRLDALIEALGVTNERLADLLAERLLRYPPEQD